MSQGNFNIKHFIIGGKDVNVTTDDLQDVPDTVRLGGDKEKILGIHWTPKDDRLHLSARMNFSKKKRGAKSGPDLSEEDFDELFPKQLTLRMYLSVIASLFDPLGLGAGFSIILKHELGHIFQLSLEWDEPRPSLY